MEPVRLLRTDFRQSLARLEDRILTTGRRVEQLVGLAMTGLEQRSPDICRQVLATDDTVDVDIYRLEERILALLTLQAPVAEDLRLLLAMQKVCGNIERIGDGCVNLSRLGADLRDNAGASEPLMAQMLELGSRAERAVRTALDAFGRRRSTVDKVRSVEDQIDLLHDGLNARLVDHAVLGRAQTEWSIRMVLASRHLERIGDHAVKIAGEGVFVATGTRPKPRAHS